jgi:hypothetical protein
VRVLRQLKLVLISQFSFLTVMMPSGTDESVSCVTPSSPSLNEGVVVSWS